MPFVNEGHLSCVTVCRMVSMIAAILTAICLPASAQNVTTPPAAGELGKLLLQAEEKTEAKAWSEAAPLWRQIVELNPVNGLNWERLGTASYEIKDYPTAIRAYEKSLELRVGFPFTSAYNVACCYALSGDKKKALEWLDKAFALGWRDLPQAQTDDDLKSLHDEDRFKKLVALVDVGKMTRDEGWRYDLHLLVREIERLHYNPFRKFSRSDYEAAVGKLDADIPRLNDNQITVGLMKLMAMAGDGHTGLQFQHALMEQHKALPVQFYLFTEGLFITLADPEHADLVGSQVLRVGDHPVDEALNALDPVISRDNAMWPKFIGPNDLRFPQILNGLNLIPDGDRVALTVRGRDGKERTVTLTANAGEPTQEWISVRKDATLPTPLYLKNRQAPYWFEYLPDAKTVFFQYNAVQDDPKEPLTKFCSRLFKFIADHDVNRLVIDMRWNGGGNNFLNTPLLKGLMSCDKIDEKGKLFVIVGRNTFSAAMCGVAPIVRYANAICVGEPTGSCPNFVGESVPLILPYSKLRGTISDLYWENAVAMDYRTWIAPQLYAPPSFEVFRANRDPAMEAITAFKSDA